MELESAANSSCPRWGSLCEYGFDIPDMMTNIELGGWGWAPVEAAKLGDANFAKPRCPGDFMAPSRYAFYPRPTERIQNYGRSHGKALRAASLKIVERMIENEGAKLCAENFVPHVQEMIKGNDLRSERDLLARNLIGIMEGMLPPTNGILRGILYEWLDQRRRSGAIRRRFGARRHRRAATFDEAKRGAALRR